MSGVCKNLENFEYFDNLFCPFGDFLKLNFFEYFIRESVPFFLTALMFIALILFIIYYQSKIRSLSKELTLTLNFLQKKINGKNNFEKRKLFYENYNDINDYFNETKFLKYPWDEFSETLITPSPQAQIQDIRNSVTSNNFFNQPAIFNEAKIRPEFLSFVPSLFISVGLLLTFIGLVAALMKTGNAFGIDATTESMMISLEELLQAATFKFVTSIAGIGSALVFNIYSRNFIYAHQTEKIDNICSIFEKSLRYESVEKLSISILEQSKQQTTVFDKFGEDFAVALGDKLAPIQTELQNMAGQFGQMNQEAINNMITEFQSNLTNNSQELIEDLTKKLLEVGDKIGNLSTSMSTTGDEFNSQLSSATNNMVQAIEDINSKISQQGEVFEGIAKSTMGAVESIERSTATFTEITEPLKEITSKIETALIQMGQTTDKLSTLQEGMEKVVDSINSSTNTMQDTWNDYQTRFKDIDESFSNSLEKFGTAMNVNQQNAQDFIRDIETQFKSSLQTLSSAISNFEDSIEELQITFNKQISQNQTEQTTDNQ